MFKTVKNRVWAFDAEWIPDPVAGRLLYDLPESAPDLDILRHMWREGGATDEDPTPYLKTVVCRIVSVAAGRLDDIVAYNEFDALTTYLVWLRVAHFGGHFTDKQYEIEQQLVRELTLSEIENGKTHLKKYLQEWDRLKARIK